MPMPRPMPRPIPIRMSDSDSDVRFGCRNSMSDSDSDSESDSDTRFRLRLRFRCPAAIAGLILAAASASRLEGAAVAAVDLGTTDAAAGLENTQRGDGTDGENDALTCGPAGRERQARRNRGPGDALDPDIYLYFRVVDSTVKAARALRVYATFFDDPAFASSPVEVRLHYTNAAATGPADLANTFAGHPKAWGLAGSGQWVRHLWRIEDAGFRNFMQGTSDFRLVIGGQVCTDRVEVRAETE